MSVVYLGLIVGHLKMREEYDPNTFTGCWGPTPHTLLPDPALLQENVLSLESNFICHSFLIPRGGLFLSEQKQRKNGLMKETEQR